LIRGIYFKKTPYLLILTCKNIYYNSLVGLTFLVTCYAVWTTQGNTIFSFMLIPLFLLFHEPIQYNIKDHENSQAVKLFGVLFFAYLMVFGLCMYLNVCNSGFMMPHNDYFYYSKISQFLNEGIENCYNYKNRIYDISASPYHYYEIWIAAFLNFCVNIPVIKLFLLVVIPNLIFIGLTGFISLSKHNKSKPLFVLIFCLPFLFIQGIEFGFLKKMGLESIINCNSNIFTQHRFPPIYLFIPALLLAIQEKKYSLTMALVICLSLVTYVLLPAFFGGGFLFVIFLYLKKDVDLKRGIFYLLTLIISFLLIQIFYKWNVSISEINTSFDIQFISRDKLLNPLIKATLFIGILYGVYLLIILINKKMRVVVFSLFYPFVFSICIFITSLMVWFIIYNSKDSQQLFYVAATPMINSMLIFTFLKVLDEYSWHLLILPLSVSLYFGINSLNKQKADSMERKHYSSATLKILSDKLAEYPEEELINTGFILGEKDYNTIYSFNTFFNKRGHCLDLLRDNCYQISLSDLTMEKVIKLDEKEDYLSKIKTDELNKSIYYNYVQQNKNSENYLKEFIDNYNIKLLFLSENAEIPEKLSPYLTLLVKDSLTSEKIFTVAP
jgi:hypothetical protein